MHRPEVLEDANDSPTERRGMSSPSTPSPEGVFEHAAGTLADAILLAGLAAVAGLVATIVLRRHGWRWTWATMVLPVSPLAWSASWRLGFFTCVGALVTTRTSLRWHQRDLQAGGDVALAAAERIGPLDRLRVHLAGRTVAHDGWVTSDGLAVGLDDRGAAVRIPLGDRAGSHTLVAGATGAGKTVTQTWIAVRAIEHGHGAIVVDPKGDDELRDRLRSAARAQARAFLEWTPNGPATYNPYAHGADTEIVDKALSAERYTEPHYLRQAQRYLGHAVRAMRAGEVTISPRSLVRYLDPIQLEVLGRDLPEDHARELWRYLDSLTTTQQRDLAGTRDRLAILAESDVGRWLDPESQGADPFSLMDAVRWRAVVLFRLEADRRPLLGQMLGAAIVQDLLATSAHHQQRPTPTLVVIDEFSALGAPQVARLFARTRAAGWSLLLGTQELADLRLGGKDTVLDQVLGNLGALIAHRQVVPASAELVAGVAGTRGTWVTQQHTRAGLFGVGPTATATRTRGREYLIHPDQIKALPAGSAAVIVPAGPAEARIARMLRTQID
jgi:hypothetical protein